MFNAIGRSAWALWRKILGVEDEVDHKTVELWVE